jgi:hypothetical protein
MIMKAFIVTEDYNRLARYRYTAFSEARPAEAYMLNAQLPANVLAYVTETNGPGSDPEGFTELHVQLHEVPWPETGGKPAERATVIAISQTDGFEIQLLVVALQDKLKLEQYPWFQGYSTVCPENEGMTAALVLDGPTYESGDTSI